MRRGTNPSFTIVNPNGEIRARDFTEAKDAYNNYLRTSPKGDYSAQSSINDNYSVGSEVQTNHINILYSKLNDISKYCVCNSETNCGCQSNCPSNCTCRGHCTCNCNSHCPCNTQCSCHSQQVGVAICSWSGTITGTGAWSMNNHVSGRYKGTYTMIEIDYTIYPYSSGWSKQEFKNHCSFVDAYSSNYQNGQFIHVYNGSSTTSWCVPHGGSWYSNNCYIWSRDLEGSDFGYYTSHLGKFKYTGNGGGGIITNSSNGFIIRCNDTSISGNIRLLIEITCYGTISQF